MDHHDLSRRAKDMGSAAVMMSLLLFGAVWASAAWVRFTA
jgi:diacylglycerol kinase (ATP)